MANTRQIKRRITASQNIAKITKAMEMVAASKMKRAQEQALAARPYSQALAESLQKVSALTDSSLHPLLSYHDDGKDIALLLSTEKGLCGSLNTTLFKALLHWFEAHPHGEVIAIGKKGTAFCRIAGLPLYAQFTSLPEKIKTSDILPITSLVMDEFLKGNFRSVTLFYTDFINTLSQKLQTYQLLPMQPADDFANEAMITPAITAEYTFEPDATTILDSLLPYYVENAMYHAFLESRASEQSARMVAMKNASENASDLVSELKLVFNKSRQASITSELLDITTASMTAS